MDPEESFDLERLSNGILDLIEKGRRDEAGRKCLELRTRFPDSRDWIERSAKLHDARGDVGKAVENHRPCLACIDRNPDGFDAESREWYQERIDRCTAPADERG